MNPICIGCNCVPDQIPEYVEYGQMEEMTADEYVIEFEGTYNTSNGHFACTDCYVRMGMPTDPGGWKAP